MKHSLLKPLFLLPCLIHYAVFHVPEIWRWIENRLEIYRLVDAAYVQVENSVSLSEFPCELVSKILELRFDVDETDLVRRFRTAISD